MGFRFFLKEVPMRRFLLPLLAGTAVLVLNCGLYAQDDAKEIIKKAIAATGGEEKLNKFKGYKDSTKGMGSLAGMDFEFKSSAIVAPPNRAKTTMKLEAGGMEITFEQQIDGDKVTAKVNGMEQPVTDEQKEDGKQQLLMRQAMKLTPLLADKNYELKPAEAIKVDGKEAVGIKVSGKNMKEITFYFDKSTNLLVKVERPGLEPPAGTPAKQEMIFKDYKDVDGVKRPTKFVMLFDGKKFLEATIVEQHMLEKIDDKDFSD